ncbi:DNA gyrase subunit A [Candidatus Woesearchaeota archaeon]|nr:MAG: DNA gyrase subunit A [Candidatus Woesearchaeota archaeon]
MEASEPEKKERIIPKVIEEEMKTSFLDYAMSVIVSRALPDVKDGLKPVHRRILFAMNEMGMHYNKPFKKSARIVGEVLGKYHPHGDTAVYDSMVRMAQDFSLRYTLIQGQGNFGSIDGDRPAAMRYTEARLSKIAGEMLQDIEKNTVKFVPNFDNSLKEPLVLPSKLPNLLVNGSSGIAVGMATSIPPNNLKEVAETIIRVIDNPDLTVREIMDTLQGPDFPTGGIIAGRQAIINAYASGRGRIRVKAKTRVEEIKGKKSIIVDEIPYMVNKSMMIEEVAHLVRNKKIQGISDIRDESDKKGMRVVFELKKDANPDVVLNQLFKHTKLQTTFSVNLVALVDNEPKTLNVKQLINYFINHRRDVVRKRTQFDLDKAEKRAHILEGIITALGNIDKVIKLIKSSKSVEVASKSLISNFKLTKEQAQAILEMKLQRLTSLEQEKIKEEHKSLLKLIEELKSILASEERILGIIKHELAELSSKYGDERKTMIMDAEEEDIEIEDLIKPEDVVVTISNTGYIKRVPLAAYREQKRGGKGVIATGMKDDDYVESLFIANTRSYILFFSDRGRVHWLKVFRIPEGSRQSKGRPIVNLLELEKEEKITAHIPIKEFDESHFLMMCTRKGIVKKTPLKAYSRPRKGGIIAITLDKDDYLMGVKLTDGTKQVMLATRKGRAIKFHERDVRPMGRSAHGVRGIKIRESDNEVVDMIIADDNKTILTVTENGYGKRTKISEYRLISRGGVGVINIICSQRNGNVVSVKSVEDDDGIMFISKKGIVIRTIASEISVIGRNTQGVRLMRLSQGDKVVSAARIIKED